MKTKILYILVSDDSDIYLEQTFVSIYSLKYHNPDAHVTLLVDDITNANLKDKRSNFLKYINEKIVVKLDCDLTKMQRSRFLKTSARLHVTGDYLYIDSDTIITAPLNEIDSFTFPIGAVKDLHVNIDTHSDKKYIKNTILLSYQLNENINYYNSGVLYVKDISLNRDFYSHWHQNWIMGMSKNIYTDQPSLDKTNQEMDYIITELNGIWNCQILYNGLPYLLNAYIIHYFSSSTSAKAQEQPYYFMSKAIFLNIKHKGNIDNEVINHIINAKNAFAERVRICSGKEMELLNFTFWEVINRMDKKQKLFNSLELITQKIIEFKKHLSKNK